MDPYEWQLEIVDKILKTKELLVKAPPGAGKTYTAQLVWEALQEQGCESVMVVVHTTALKQQWASYGFEAETVHTAIKTPVSVDLLILDECHHYESQVWKQVHQIITAQYILGLSATPGDASMRFQSHYTVNWDQIPLPDISIHYHRFSLDRRSKQAYDYWTEKIQSVNKLDLEPSDIDDLRLMYAIKRRRIVHLCPVRHTEVVGHYFEMVGERTLIVCEAIAQANHIAKDLGLPVYHSKNADPSILEKFQTGETPCIVSVKMLKEGFNCPAIDTIIIVSSALTEQNLVQVVGRGLRVYGDKKVAIHIFIAADTTDTKLVGLAEGILGVTQLSKDADRFPEYQWRRGTLVSIDTRGRIFKANKNGRAYYKETGLEKQITEVMGRAGRFRIYEGQVIVRDPEGRHHNLGRIELVKEEGSQSLSGNKITWEELFT